MIARAWHSERLVGIVFVVCTVGGVALAVVLK